MENCSSVKIRPNMGKCSFAVIVVLFISLTLFAAATHRPRHRPPVATGCITCGMNVVPDLPQRLAKWKAVDMPFHSEGLSASEVQMVQKLALATQYLDDIYWRQSDPEGLALLRKLRGSKNPQDQQVRRMLIINGSRYDLLDDNKPFIGTEPFRPGRGFYPLDLTREQMEAYVKSHPDQKDKLYNAATIVQTQGTNLQAIPYSVQFKEFLEPAAKALREAAELSNDKAFANFLRLRADALLNDDYYKSDLAWVDLKNPKIDVIMAPYETYLDALLGIKTSYGPSVMIRNEDESKKLELFEKYVPDIQDALPLAAEDRPSKKGQPTPMEVVDAPFRGGDLRHGYQAVADNLPNDPRIHAAKGTKKLFFKNFMDARVNYIILPIAKVLMIPEQAANASGDGYLAATIMHEICHGLGPAYSRVNGKQVDIREAIGPTFGGLEEAKADVVGMFALKWLIDRGALPKEKLQEYYASYLAGNFRTLRFGVGEAHGQAEMMEFNYHVEHGAFQRDEQGRYFVDYDKLSVSIAALAKELLAIEATGDRARASAWMKKYDVMPNDLVESLKKVSDVPVDLDPKFSFAEDIE
jgi:hypothetical protein